MGTDDNLQVACQAKRHTLLLTFDTWPSAVTVKNQKISFVIRRLPAVAIAEPNL
jgi:hypothetical protein